MLSDARGFQRSGGSELDEPLRAFDVDETDREAVMEAVAGFEDDVVERPSTEESLGQPRSRLASLPVDAAAHGSPPSDSCSGAVSPLRRRRRLS